MKNLFLLFLLLLVQLVVAPQIKAQKKERVFEVPSDYTSFFLLNKPDCPLQLSDPKVLRYENGLIGNIYKITNNSLKSVKSFQIKEFYPYIRSEYISNYTAKDEFEFPFQEVFSKDKRFEYLPLDKRSALEFELSKERKKISVVIVTKVELYDGTKYDATEKYSRLKELIERIEDEEFEANDNIRKLTTEEKETKFREFIVKEELLNYTF